MLKSAFDALDFFDFIVEISLSFVRMRVHDNAAHYSAISYQSCGTGLPLTAGRQQR